VQDEREHVRTAVERVRNERRFRDCLNVHLIAWDQPGVSVAMEAGLTPQEAIASGMPKPEECDLVVVILWSRMGTPLPPAYRKPDGSAFRSGTEWEYVNAIEGFRRRGKPAVWIYHRTQTITLSEHDPDFKDKSAQLDAVHSFLGSLKNLDGSIAGGVNQYATPTEFGKQFEDHLRDGLERSIINGPLHTPRIPMPFPQDRLVARPALLKKAKALVFNDAATVRCTRLCFHGQPGAGKTVAAAVFALDAEVKRAFPDGVLWATLGQNPNVLARLSAWGQLVNDPRVGPAGYPDMQTATTLLAEHLGERRCLLVVDDVWSADHLRPFCFEGAASLLLTTTRQGSIADAVGSVALDIGEMQKQEAMDLLERWSGPIAAVDRPIALRLAEAVGFLPLALELIGGRVRRSSWADYEALWKKSRIDAVRRGRHAAGRQDSVRDSFDLSLNALAADRDAYLQLGVFPEDVSFPASAAAALWDCDAVDAREVLEDFVDQALISEGGNAFRLHDVPREVTRAYLGEAGITQAHARILEGYSKRCTGGWASGPNDGYFHDHLALHLAASGRVDALFELINRQWMLAQFERESSYHQFAADTYTSFAAARDASPRRYFPLVRCALIYGSLGTIATKVSPRILGALARAGRGTQALGYATLIDAPQQTCQAYVEIGRGLTSTGEVTLAHDALTKAFAACKRMTDTSKQADELGAIANAMADIGDTDGVCRTWEYALAMDSLYRQNAVNYVCEPLIRVGRLDLALDFIHNDREGDRNRNWIETIIAETLMGAGKLEELRQHNPDIPGNARSWTVEYQLRKQAADGQVSDALGVARAAGVIHRSALLAAVISGIGERGNWEDLGLAVNASNEIADPGLRVSALASVAPLMARAGDIDSLIAVRDELDRIADERQRADARETLTRSFTAAGRIDLARAVIKSEPDPVRQISMLQAIALQLVDAGDAVEARSAAEAAGVALADVDSEVTQREQIRVLARLSDLPGARKLASNLSSGSVALVRGYAEAGQFDAARAVLDGVEAESQRDDALAYLVAGLGAAGRADDALELVRTIGSVKQHFNAYRDLAIMLAKRGDIETAEKVAVEVDEWAATQSVYEQLSSDTQGAVAEVLVRAGRLSEVEKYAVRALARAQHLPHDSMRTDTLLAFARALGDHGRLEEALSVFAETGATWQADDRSLADDLLRWGVQSDALLEACQHLPAAAREFSLSRVAVALAELGDIAAAEKILPSLAERWNRVDVLVAIADHEIRNGRVAEARSALDLIEMQGQDAMAVDRAWLLACMGPGLRALGEHQLLRERSLALLVEANGLTDIDEKLQMLRGVAHCLVFADELERAMQLFTDQRELWARDADWTLRDVLLKAAEVADPAYVIALAEQHIQDRGHYCADLAGAMFKRGEKALAVDLARQAWEIGKTTEDARYRTSILRNAVPVLVQVGADDLAAKAAAAALDAARLGDERDEPDDVMWAAIALAKAGEFQLARHAVELLEDRWLRIRPLCAIIEGLASAGHHDAAREMFVDALDLARTAGRQSVLEVLRSGVQAIAELDSAATVSQLLYELRQLDRWLGV